MDYFGWPGNFHGCLVAFIRGIISARIENGNSPSITSGDIGPMPRTRRARNVLGKPCPILRARPSPSYRLVIKADAPPADCKKGNAVNARENGIVETRDS